MIDLLEHKEFKNSIETILHEIDAHLTYMNSLWKSIDEMQHNLKVLDTKIQDLENRLDELESELEKSLKEIESKNKFPW